MAMAMSATKTTDNKDQAKTGATSDELVPFEPGDERLGLTELLRASLARTSDQGGGTWKHRLVAGLLRRAAEGDLKAIQEIWTRLEGKPGAAHEAARELPLFSRAISLRILRAAEAEDDDTDGGDAEDDASHDDPYDRVRIDDGQGAE